MKGLILLGGLSCMLVIGLAGLAFLALVLRKLLASDSSSGIDYDSQPGGFHDRMKAALAALSPSDPLRAWGRAFGGVGHIENDPHSRYLHFQEGPAESSELTAVYWHHVRMDPLSARLPTLTVPFALVREHTWEAGARQLQRLARYPNVMALILNRAPLSADEFRTIGEMTGLQMLATGVKDGENHGLDHLAKLPNLRLLHLWGDVNSETVGRLAGLTGLTNLRLHVGHISDSEAAVVFPRLTKLEVLSLRAYSLSPGAVGFLGRLPRLERLEYEVLDTTAAHLTAFQSLASLRTLAIGNRDLRVCPERWP